MPNLLDTQPLIAVVLTLISSAIATYTAYRFRSRGRLWVLLLAIAAGCFLLGFCVNVVHLIAALT